MKHFSQGWALIFASLIAICLGSACREPLPETKGTDSFTPKGIPIKLGNSEPNQVSTQVRKAVLAFWGRFDLANEFDGSPYPNITQTQLLDLPERSFIAVSIGEASQIYFSIKYLNDEYFVLDSTQNQMHACASNGCMTCSLAQYDSKNTGIYFGCACEDESGPCNHSVKKRLDEPSSFE